MHLRSYRLGLAVYLRMDDNLTPPERSRFNGRFTVIGACHVWDGALDRDGYGAFYLRGANRRAHRVAWYSMHGEIPDGHVINHTCRNRACVNPQHLQCVTTTANALKDSASLGYINSQKTHCPKGHPYDGTESRNGKTVRICTACRREKQRIAKRRQYRAGRARLKV
jgi:hypothetical protein